jgi:formylmethanofuran dehydrogenase subunit E
MWKNFRDFGGQGARGMTVHILDHTFEEYLKIVTTFHGGEAPGVIIGGFMVDMALRNLPEGILYEAVCETRSCLPDAIQLLTPCTVGNGRLKIIPLGRFAIAFYDKQNYNGVRVFLDAKRLEPWQEIKAWLLKLKSKKEQDKENLIREIREAGASILDIQRIDVRPEVAIKTNKGAIAMCPRCKEAYPLRDGELCRACGGENPYRSGKGRGTTDAVFPLRPVFSANGPEPAERGKGKGP